MSSVLTIRLLVDDWAVKSISFGPFETREEANQAAEDLYKYITTKAEPSSAEPGVKGNGKESVG